MSALFWRRSERKNVELNANEPTTSPAAEAAPAAEKPVRRRASRRVTAAAGAAPEVTEAPAAAPAAEAPAAPAAEAPAAAAPAAETPAEEAPKKRATRSRKKAAEPAEAADAAGAAPATAGAETPAGEAPAAEAPKKRATRSRKKAAEPAEAADTAGDAADSSSAQAAPAASEQNAPAAEASSESGSSETAAPARRTRGGRRAQSDTAAAQAEGDAQAEQAAPQGAKNDSAANDAAKSDGSESETGTENGRSRNRRGRGQKNDASEQSEGDQHSGSGDEGKSRGQNGNQQRGQGQNGQGQNGPKNDENSTRSSRTRQRDRKRRGQGDDFEPEITEDDVLLPIAGILDVLDNYAFVRTSGYLPGTSDVYVSLGQVKKYALRRGDAVVGAIRQPRDGEGGSRQKYNAIVKIDSVNGRQVDEDETRADEAELTPIFPEERLRFETTSEQLVGRSIDLVAPVGLGQRGLLVLPAQASATGLLTELAAAVTANKPDAHLMVVLTDARPEVVTQLQRTVHGEVIAATFDRAAEDQTTVAELAIDRARRLVELGHDVVVLLDSLNRLARAYAQTQPGAAKVATDVVDEYAIGQVKRLLAAARNLENGGSLTILATAQTRTGVAVDKTLLREVRQVANSEVRFTKTAVGQTPAVDLSASFTLQADTMLGADEARVLAQLQLALADDDSAETVRARLRSSSSNAALLAEIQRAGGVS